MPAALKFSNENIDTMINLYKDGRSMISLGKQFACDPKVVARILRKHNIDVVYHQFKFYTNKLEAICNDYKNGIDIDGLKRKYESDYTSIRSALERGGVQVATGYERTYEVNDNYFETIDTEEKAYWLGFIVTDGCVINGHVTDKEAVTAVTIHLKGTDIGHLEKFKKAVGFTGPIRVNKSNHNSVMIVITSKKMCEDLAKYGVVRKKTGKCYKSDLIPEHLERHFWRGCIDGDGTLSTCGYVTFVVGFVGNERLVLDFVGFCKRHNMSYTRLFQDKRSKILILQTYFWYDAAQQLMSLLYDGAKVYLDRKFERYELFTGKLTWLL